MAAFPRQNHFVNKLTNQSKYFNSATQILYCDLADKVSAGSPDIYVFLPGRITVYNSC